MTNQHQALEAARKRIERIRQRTHQKVKGLLESIDKLCDNALAELGKDNPYTVEGLRSALVAECGATELPDGYDKPGAIMPYYQSGVFHMEHIDSETVRLTPMAGAYDEALAELDREPDQMGLQQLEPDTCHYCSKPLNYKSAVYLTLDGLVHPSCAYKNGFGYLSSS